MRRAASLCSNEAMPASPGRARLVAHIDLARRISPTRTAASPGGRPSNCRGAPLPPPPWRAPLPPAPCRREFSPLIFVSSSPSSARLERRRQFGRIADDAKGLQPSCGTLSSITAEGGTPAAPRNHACQCIVGFAVSRRRTHANLQCNLSIAELGDALDGIARHPSALPVRDGKSVPQHAPRRIARLAHSVESPEQQPLDEQQDEDQNDRRNVEPAEIRQHAADRPQRGFGEPIERSPIARTTLLCGFTTLNATSHDNTADAIRIQM